MPTSRSGTTTRSKSVLLSRANNHSTNTPFGCFSSHLKIFFIRFYSTSRPDSSQSIVPVKSYGNADTMKRQMSLENNKVGESGIYRWVNTLNGKTYIGSSSNISRR